MFERVRTYNVGLVLATFVWLFSIVFLPFPTELLGASRESSVAVHGIYVGTMVVAAVATLVQQWTIVRWPELQDEEGRGSAKPIRHGVLPCSWRRLWWWSSPCRR